MTIRTVANLEIMDLERKFNYQLTKAQRNAIINVSLLRFEEISERKKLEYDLEQFDDDELDFSNMLVEKLLNAFYD